ncbi:cell division protein ZapE [Kiloniella laminariae]|uniref:Cell division protein ZapE n=1 Tax=Kiloniella laminariae TaxID=454162 RepID=A0ABT4LQ41_9PROT|nr:cell division protein ZapE [Kiloniella laminariae]MCZ4282436.1 cell division protein ZapE [Kiloniella laminariae]
MSEGPLFLYREMRNQGELRPDPAQQLAAEKLQSLFQALKNYEPSTGLSGWKERLGLGRRKVTPPQGLYLFGGVGTGKSTMMDMFFSVAPLEAKRRVHFHAFMLEVQEKLHRWRAQYKGTKADPLPDLAAELAKETWLLCFDEFHVVNIADAMILARLFESLFEHGVVVVATSNWPPDRLYENGLQRENFLPFIDVLKARLDILQLDSGVDYRLERMRNLPVYHTPPGEEVNKALDAAFEALTEGAQAVEEIIPVKGRQLVIRRAARKVALCGFEELCGAALGAGDYLAIAGRYHTLVLSDVPVLGPENRDRARRFMSLIDALYEHRCNLVMSAEAEPEALYPSGDGAFEFERTASRLQEMRSQEYIALPHLG